MNEHVLSGFNNVSLRTERRILVAIGASVIVHALVLSLGTQRETVLPVHPAPIMTLRSVSQAAARPKPVTGSIEEIAEAKPAAEPLPLESAPTVTKTLEPVPTPVPNWQQLGKLAARQAANQEPAYRPMNQLPEVDFEPPRPESARKPFLESYVSIYGDDMMRYGNHCFVYKQPGPFEPSTASDVMLITRC